MRKLFVISILLGALAGVADAAIKHEVKMIRFKHDRTLGTFVDRGTHGYITGVTYVVSATDTVTGVNCSVGGEVTVAPRSSFPSKTVVMNAISQNITSSGLKTYLIACIARLNEEALLPDVPAASNASDYVPALEGSEVTPP